MLPMNPTRVAGALLCATATVCAGCGHGTTTPSLPTLSHTAASRLAAVGSAWLTRGPYAFSEQLSQQSTPHGVSGLSPDGVSSSKGSITATITGKVASATAWTATATIDGESRPLHLAAVDCTGYAALGTGGWTTGPTQLTVANDVSPALLGGMGGLPWRETAVASLGGHPLYVLHADITQAALGPSASQGGITVAPGWIELWISPTSGHVARLALHTDITYDLHILADASGGTVTGTDRSRLTLTASFTPTSVRVSRPSAAAGTDPIPDAVIHGFGIFDDHGTGNCPIASPAPSR